jgi:AraC-like DNA-binding protein
MMCINLSLPITFRVAKSMAQTIPLTRSGVVGHYARHFQALGVPTERLLQKAGIPPDLLEIPDAVVHLERAYRFAELACQNLSCEHVGANIGQASSLDDFSSYGANLKNSYTLGDYLSNGIASYSTLTTGEYFWLSDLGSEIRFNIESPGACSAGMYQSHLCTIAVTIASCRQFTGQQWSPREIGLAYRSREKLPTTELFEGSRILRGLGYSYITIPKAILNLRPLDTGTRQNSGSLQPGAKLPDDLIGIVLKQMEALSAGGHELHIETLSESLAMSKRTLQRKIAQTGLTYMTLLGEVRLRRAVHWLSHTNKPIIEIALELGYTDTSNFSRAFRRGTGLSPSDFRYGLKQA